MSADSSPSPRGHHAALTILIVEDEVLVRFALADELRNSSHQVVEAATADEAAELLAAGLEVDLILSDIRMPGRLDGVALVKHVQEHHGAIPVILLSSHFPEGDLGTAVLVPKPYRLDRLLRVIQEVAATK